MDADFQFYVQALNARAYRQQVLASNIANADTPHYRAQDVDFQRLLSEKLNAPASSGTLQLAGTGGVLPLAGNSGALQLAVSSGRDLPGLATSALDDAVYYRTPLQSSLDKNSVDMNIERAQFSDNAIHYEATLAFLNQNIKIMQSAISG